MITESILIFFKDGFLYIISMLPEINIAIPSDVMSNFYNIVKMSGYLLPMGTLLTCFSLWVVTVNFEIVWKIIQRVWDALPLT